ncbi:DHA2 family efflux MFS transporter permease subunit [Alkalihalobacillus sp. 1P02AB]|uniref:DHA2 family efflux MFS transporter permease subunit n=1 Tax=Alkalihalobacillus sp. 1P02AB TaxID=3132260 RepID=UPI0039A641A0
MTVPSKQPFMTIVITLMLGNFLAVSSMSSINIVVPEFTIYFQADLSQVQWVMSGFLLASGVISPLSGWLGDRLTYRKLYQISLCLFMFTSVLCTLAWSIESLNTFRVFQGFACGLIVPASMTLIYILVEKKKRPLALSFWSVGAIFGPAIGPTLAGFLASHFGWKSIFLLNVPIGVITMVFIFLYIPKSEKAIKEGNFSWTEFLTIFGGSGFILYSVNLINWPFQALIILLFGIMLLSIFIKISFRKKQPLLNLKVFHSKMFSITTVTSCVLLANLYIGTFFMPVYLQDVLNQSSLEAGLTLMPSALAMGMTTIIAGKIYRDDRVSVLFFLGIALLLASSVGLSFLTVTSSYVTVLMWMVFRNIGISLALIVLTNKGMASTEKHLVGHASASINWLRQSSSAFIISIMTVAVASLILFYEANGLTNLAAFTESLSLAFIVNTVLVVFTIPVGLYLLKQQRRERKRFVQEEYKSAQES